MDKLIIKQPAVRLGRNGVQDIKSHIFFQGIDFKAYEQHRVLPPIDIKIEEYKG